MMKWQCSVVLVIAGLGCGTDASDEGSATGSFSAAYVNASMGALQVVLSNGDSACKSREKRREFDRQEGLRIRLLAVDRRGELSRSGDSFYTEVYPGSSDALTALNAFVATALPERSSDGALDWNPPTASSGKVELDEKPNYDMGAVRGSYSLTIGDQSYEGSFDTRYCPTDDNVDTKGLGIDMYNHCSFIPHIPYEPGASWSGTYQRDIKRGVLAMGLSDSEASCMQDKVDTYCKAGWPDGWGEMQGECFHAELDECLGLPRSISVEMCPE